jgi:ABC-2 type transport system permease protein
VISLSILRNKPNEKLYKGPPKAVAVLLEGKFKSYFDNRIPPSLMIAKEIGFRNRSQNNSMIVVSDGDVIRNQFKIPEGYPLPLGYDQFTHETFGNKDFILNSLNYLTGGYDLVSLRSRQIKLRLLDMTKVNNDKFWIQIVNVMAPVVIVVISGMILLWLRKRKYGKKTLRD